MFASRFYIAQNPSFFSKWLFSSLIFLFSFEIHNFFALTHLHTYKIYAKPIEKKTTFESASFLAIFKADTNVNTQLGCTTRVLCIQMEGG